MELHKCEFKKHELQLDWHGVAITACEENERGELWVNNREYGNRVNYCPFCGYEAKMKFGVPITKIKD